MFCLVVQKDTLENDKIKAILRSTNDDLEKFLSDLQTGHCIEYQLLAHTKNSDVNDKVLSVVSLYKTNYGKDWYDLDHNVLAEIISLFLEHGTSIINLKCISEIMGFSLKIFPVVNKEIKISSINNITTSSSEIAKDIKTDKTDNTDKVNNNDKKDEEKPRDKHDKHDKHEKTDKHDKNDKRDESLVRMLDEVKKISKKKDSSKKTEKK